MDPLNPYAAPQGSELKSDERGPIASPEFLFAPILSLGLTLYFSNFAAVAFVTVAVWLPLEIIRFFMEYYVFEWYELHRFWAFYDLAENLAGLMATGGVVAIGGASMRGERVWGWMCLQKGLRAWPRMLWTQIVYGMAVLLALLAFVFPAVFVGVRLLFADAVTVLEGTSGGESLKRSFQLTAGNFWRLFALFLVTLGAIFLGFFFTESISEQTAYYVPPYVQASIAAALNILGQLLAPVQTLVLVAAYFAGKRRLTEQPGFDLSQPDPVIAAARDAEDFR